MRNGNYLIHVYIQEGHSIKLKNYDAISPLLEVEVCGLKKVSKPFNYPDP
jgi:hypothetical protein